MNDMRARFTKWYYRKGYRMMYRPCDYGDSVAELVFFCPWWVRPFVELLFSPCVYHREFERDSAEYFIVGFEQGLKEHL